MRKTYLVLAVLTMVGCQEIGEPESVHDKNVLRIENATEEQVALFGDWLGQDNENARIAMEFDPNKLVQISQYGYSRWAVPSNKDPNASMSFIFDSEKSIDKAFISRSFPNPDGSITSEVYDLQNRLMADIIHSPDGSVRILRNNDYVGHGFRKWWNEFEYCVDKVVNPFESTVANIVTGVIFQAATYNMWLPAVGLVCAGVASGRHYQN